MVVIKKIVKYIAYFLGLIVVYLLSTIFLSFITVNKNSNNLGDNAKTIYLSTNGVHLSIIIPKEDVNSNVLSGLQYQQNQNYFMFGWGNEDFYLNTPTWSDFKFKYGFGALFLDTPTAIHLTTYYYKQTDWVAVKCSEEELDKLNMYVFKTFKMNSIGKKQLISQNLYGENNTFYKANGSYSVTKTCNTWANEAFKKSGLKASYFTIFDFGLLQKYE